MSLSIVPVAGVTRVLPPAAAPKTAAPTGFGSLVSQAVDGLTTTTTHADQALTQALAGHGSVTNAMIAVSRSQTALDVAAAVRNATVQAAQSFFTMQV